MRHFANSLPLLPTRVLPITLVWQIVGEPEADAARGMISINSPVARALIGKSKGGVVEVMTPSGVKNYKITKVAWLNSGVKK
jgi:transcription elongation GreA/GreB family factor